MEKRTASPLERAYNYGVTDWTCPAQAWLGLARTHLDGLAAHPDYSNRPLERRFGMEPDFIKKVAAAPSDLHRLDMIMSGIQPQQLENIFTYVDQRAADIALEKRIRGFEQQGLDRQNFVNILRTKDTSPQPKPAKIVRPISRRDLLTPYF